MAETLKKIDITKLPNSWTVTGLCRLASDLNSPFWQRQFHENKPRTDADLLLANAISIHLAAMLDAVQPVQANGIPWGEAMSCVGSLCRRIEVPNPNVREIGLQAEVISPLVRSLIRKQETIANLFSRDPSRADVASYLGDTVVDYGSKKLFKRIQGLGLRTHRTVK